MAAIKVPVPPGRQSPMALSARMFAPPAQPLPSGPPPSGGNPSDAAGATDSMTVSQVLFPASADVAGAVDAMTVVQVPFSVPGPAASLLPPASPAFIRSQMPRMHIQNLLTKQWFHRDVQGITSPSITWNLNNPDTLSFTLAPPRPDMMIGGEPILLEWRDAIYLEENDLLKWGGIVTSSNFNGPQWTIGATGFCGYANGTIYEGGSVTEYNVDALDVVRQIWNWIQAQANGNIGLQLDTTKSGVLLGANVTNRASGYLKTSTSPVTSTVVASAVGGASLGFGITKNTILQRMVLTDSQNFSAGMLIQIDSDLVRVVKIVTNAQNLPTGEILTNRSAHPHNAGAQVLQVPAEARLTNNAFTNGTAIHVDNPAAFSTGMTILFPDNRPYQVTAIETSNITGIPTGVMDISPALREGHSIGEIVKQAAPPFQLLWWNNTDCGQEIASIQAEAVFDWFEAHAWTSPAKEEVIHRMGFGVPRIGTRKPNLRFAEGENIIQPVQVTRDGTAFADEVIGIGAGSGSSAIHSTVSELSGRLRRVSVYNDQTVTTVARMSSKARQVLNTMKNIDSPTQVTVKNHPNAPFGSFAPGDDIPVTLCTGWRNTVIWCRITSMKQDPTTDIMTLTVARSDSFAYMAQSGQAGTI